MSEPRSRRLCPRRLPRFAALGLGLGLNLSLGACDRAAVVLEQPDETPAPPLSPHDDPLVVHEAVREAVREYAAALDRRDPVEARARVVSETFSYYEDLRLAALRATREQLERWDLMSVILILQIRSTLTRTQLEDLDGAALFERAVIEGLVGADAAALPLDHVWLDEAGERAEIRIDDEAVVWLRLEHSWRVDIPAMIRVLGPALELVARERVLADGKVWTAFNLLAQTRDAEIEIVDGALDDIALPSP